MRGTYRIGSTELYIDISKYIFCEMRVNRLRLDGWSWTCSGPSQNTKFTGIDKSEKCRLFLPECRLRISKQGL